MFEVGTISGVTADASVGAVIGSCACNKGEEGIGVGMTSGDNGLGVGMTSGDDGLGVGMTSGDDGLGVGTTSGGDLDVEATSGDDPSVEGSVDVGEGSAV